MLIKEEILSEFEQIYKSASAVIFKDTSVSVMEEFHIALKKAYAQGAKNMAKTVMLDKVQELLEKTFTGCHCGLHGYLVLPDCDEENHGDSCARCLLRRLEKECRANQFLEKL